MTATQDSTKFLHDSMPLAASLGIEVLDFSPELLRTRMPWRPDLCTSADVLHGGALMALADATGAALAFLNLPDGAAGTTTSESKTNFFRALTSGEATATASPLHVGRRMIVVETEIRDGTDRLISKTTQTQIVI